MQKTILTVVTVATVLGLGCKPKSTDTTTTVTPNSTYGTTNTTPADVNTAVPATGVNGTTGANSTAAPAATNAPVTTNGTGSTAGNEYGTSSGKTSTMKKPSDTGSGAVKEEQNRPLRHDH
jgi:hypothetical protein